MRITLSTDAVRRLTEAMRRAGNREIGGILMGEHIDEGEFRVIDITVQISGGTVTTFWRYVEDFMMPLRRFFERTEYNYLRYNYLGEWHSHPSFVLRPSDTDIKTMQEIVEDPESNVNFAVLLLTGLDSGGALQSHASLHIPFAPCVRVLVETAD